MKFEGFVEKKTFRVSMTEGIRESFQHYETLSKEEYRKILEQRVEQFVVQNKRIINPIDDRDVISHFHCFWEGEKLLGVCRLVPPFTEEWEEEIQYPIIDKCTVVDRRLSMFCGAHAIDAHCFENHCQDLITLYRSSNSMMEMYTEGHELIKHGKETYGVGHELERYRWIGVTDDAWGFPSYRWVHEEHTQEEWLERIAPILH
jgi:hypothetical protein